MLPALTPAVRDRLAGVAAPAASPAAAPLPRQKHKQQQIQQQQQQQQQQQSNTTPTPAAIIISNSNSNSNSKSNSKGNSNSSSSTSSNGISAARMEAVALKQRAPDVVLLDEALLDCYGRFFALLPESLLRDSIHLYFQVQEAWWWYTDMWLERYKERLQRLSLRDFGLLLFADCPLLQFFCPLERHDFFLMQWQGYCRKIPLRGSIVMNEDLTKCLLVTVSSFDSPLFVFYMLLSLLFVLLTMMGRCCCC